MDSLSRQPPTHPYLGAEYIDRAGPLAVIGTYWPTDVTPVTVVLPVPLATLYQLSREENAQGYWYGPPYQ